MCFDLLRTLFLPLFSEARVSSLTPFSREKRILYTNSASRWVASWEGQEGYELLFIALYHNYDIGRVFCNILSYTLVLSAFVFRLLIQLVLVDNKVKTILQYTMFLLTYLFFQPRLNIPIFLLNIFGRLYRDLSYDISNPFYWFWSRRNTLEPDCGW